MTLQTGQPRPANDLASHPRVLGAIDAVRARGGRRVAAFDFDNTLIWNDLGDATFYRLLDERRLVVDDRFWARIPERYGREALRRVWDEAVDLDPVAARLHPSHTRWVGGMLGVYRDLVRDEGTRVAYPLLTRLHAGLSRTGLTEFGRQTLTRELGRDLVDVVHPALDGGPVSMSLGIRIHAAAEALVTALAGAGFEVWIVTASPRDVIAGVSGRWGVPAGRVVGMDLEDDGDRLGDRLREPVTCYEGKVEAIAARIGAMPAIAAGDSVSDEAMLRCTTDLAILFDRGRADLRQRLLDRGALVHPFPVPRESP